MSLFILNKTSWLALESQNRVRSQYHIDVALLFEKRERVAINKATIFQ